MNHLTFLLALLIVHSKAFGLCVSVEEANLRAAPSSEAKKVWTVGKYMPLLALTQKGSWIQVRDLEGKKMWIYSDLVTDEYDCAVVKVARANLRKGPDSSFAQTPLSFAHKYMPFKKIGRDGAWLYLEDDYGFKHWAIETNIWEPLNYTQLSY